MTAAAHARRCREQFALRRQLVLELAADSNQDPLATIVAIEKQFTAITLRFFRAHPKGHTAWREHGPDVDLAEIRAAFTAGPTHWTALMERVRKAREDRTNGR